MARIDNYVFSPTSAPIVPPRAATPETATAPLTALVFDMGDVLYDAGAWRRWLHSLLRQMGVRQSFAEVFGQWDRDYLDAVHAGKRNYDEAFLAFLNAQGLSPGQIDEILGASGAFRRKAAGQLRPFRGVPETLRQVQQLGIKLAVLSDSESPAAELMARMNGLGLEGRFTAAISSCELGVTKPDARCYQAALQALNAAPEQTAFVGHDAEELNGARRCGLRTLAFNFDGDSRADVYLSRFEELLGAVQRWIGATCVR